MKPDLSLKSIVFRLLRSLALLLRLSRIFLPGILVVVGMGVLMSGFIQGRDVIMITLESEWRGFFFMTGLLFWATVTWYSSRLIAYNQDDLFNEFPSGLYHAPRILGFACFTVVLLALLALPPLQWGRVGWLIWSSLQLLTYIVASRLFESIRDQYSERILIKLRNGTILAISVLFIIAAIRNELISYLLTLPFLQIGLLFIVMVRRKIRDAELDQRQKNGAAPEMIGRSARWLRYILSNPPDNRTREYKDKVLQGEIAIFKVFNVVAIISLTIWMIAIFNLPVARLISTLPIVLLALGVLLGIGNLISLFSVKTGTNLHIVFIAATFAVGSVIEPHNVRRTWPVDISIGNNYNYRQDVKTWFRSWSLERKAEIKDSSIDEYPVFLLLADGGASRSAYWAAGVWSTLEEKTQGKFSRHLICLSGTSGGSLGNVAFYTAMTDTLKSSQQTNVREECRNYLSQDFLSHTMARLLGPDLLKPLFPLDIIYDRAAALENSLEEVPGHTAIAKKMGEPFSGFFPAGSGSMPILFINTTRMQDGRPAVVSNIKINDSVYGKRIDVLSNIPAYDDIRLSTAVVLGARFPYISPAGRLEENYFVDGGYFDNSGAGVVHETLIELKRIIDDSLKKDPKHWLGKLRFHVLHATNAPQKEPQVTKVHPIVNDLFAPVKTLLGAYASQTDVNNLRLSRFLTSMHDGETRYIRFNLYRNGEEDNFPMNWVISRENLRRIDDRINNDSTLKALAAKLNGHVRGKSQ
jgi:predicted acylesterase/phospholipase RssA